MTARRPLASLLCALSALAICAAQETPPAPVRTLTYASRDGADLVLDLYLPASDAPPFLIMHGLADNSVPHGQSVLLYEALKTAGNDVTLRLVDGLPHTFFNRTDLDDVAGPFRMDVREYSRGGTEVRRVDRDGVFNVARQFFRRASPIVEFRPKGTQS